MSIFCVAGILMGFSITHSGFEVNAQLSTVKGSKVTKEILPRILLVATFFSSRNQENAQTKYVVLFGIAL